jgi:hypothetical protein
MTEPAAVDAASVNEARWLRRECILAHIALAILLVLGAVAGWSGANVVGVGRTQGILLGLALPVGIYFVYSIIYGFRVWVSMEARLEQLSHVVNNILTGQSEGFASVQKHFHAKIGAPSPRAEGDAEQERALVAKIERENADWLYDAKGNATKEAEAVRQYIEQAKRLGINGAQARWDYATAMVERDLMREWMERNRRREDSEQPAAESRNAAPQVL